MKINRKPGYATFMTVLIIMGAILMFMGFSSLSSISFGKTGLTVKKGLVLRAGAEGCLEEALLRLRNDWKYTSENLNIDDVSCGVEVTGSGQDRTITVRATNERSDELVLRALVKRKGFSVNLVSKEIVENE